MIPVSQPITAVRSLIRSAWLVTLRSWLASLRLLHPALTPVDLTGDRGRIVKRREDEGPGDVSRRAESAERGGRDDLADAFGRPDSTAALPASRWGEEGHTQQSDLTARRRARPRTAADGIASRTNMVLLCAVRGSPRRSAHGYSRIHRLMPLLPARQRCPLRGSNSRRNRHPSLHGTEKFRSPLRGSFRGMRLPASLLAALRLAWRSAGSVCVSSPFGRGPRGRRIIPESAVPVAPAPVVFAVVARPRKTRFRQCRPSRAEEDNASLVDGVGQALVLVEISVSSPQGIPRISTSPRSRLVQAALIQSSAVSGA